MLVGGKSISDAALLHHHKGRTVRQAPFLVGTLKTLALRISFFAIEISFQVGRPIAWALEG